MQGDWNAKVGKDTQENWQDICGPFCNTTTNERGLRLLEFATYNKLGLANAYGPHKASRRWTWDSVNGQHHNQIDYKLLKQRFQSGLDIAKMRSFPGADIGSDHDLVMMNFRLHLKKIVKPKQVRMKFALEKLKDPKIAEAFQAMIGGKFAPLTILEEENTDIETLTNKFNNAMTDTASVILDKHRQENASRKKDGQSIAPSYTTARLKELEQYWIVLWTPKRITSQFFVKKWRLQLNP